MKKLPHVHFILFLVVLLGGIALALTFMQPAIAVVAAFDAAACAFLASVAPLWWTGTPAQMRINAARNDAGRALLMVVSIVVAAVILVALGLVVEGNATLSPAYLALIVATMVLAWSFVNGVYTLHYAHLFYDWTKAGADHLGLSFPETKFPEFSDFFYFSFVIGMTCQVSDVSITSPRLRRVAIIHGILAFFFNLGVLALTINVLAGVL